MVGEACLPSNAYYPRTADYTFYFGVHVSWSEHFDLSFVYGFMSLDYGLGTMTTTTLVVLLVLYGYLAHIELKKDSVSFGFTSFQYLPNIFLSFHLFHWFCEAAQTKLLIRTCYILFNILAYIFLSFCLLHHFGKIKCVILEKLRSFCAQYVMHGR